VARKPVRISDAPEFAHLNFDAYGKGRKHFTDILHRWPERTPLQGQDLEDVLALIKHHPEYDARIAGRPILGVMVDARDYGTPCFHACFRGDEVAHFSIGSCLDAARDATENRLSTASS